MGSIVESVVEETAAVAQDIFRTTLKISQQKTEGETGRVPPGRGRSPPSSSVPQRPRRQL